ncbi:organic hydroperoxide resistance protein [Paenibacillus sp. IB182496]|uniref:Organic hydroperoxide resistance protein n=1 Tax=Paenibacillus sabuli TaxID=2772509 RepID=A0A927BQS4_9BACL|nr:organic hydroperoxide resistance protein [Paenibacillus sabuli]MBD2843773.1 organic hydroperoxide resistance protein [Paenibacillus sabuli]
MEALYTTTATAIGGRNGKVETADGTLKHELSMPKELGGSGGDGTNPEQMFAAGYAACFESALNLVARQQDVSLQEVSVSVHVSLGKDEADDGFKLAVKIDVYLPGLEQDQAAKLAEAAHQACPYSKATRGNIEVEVNSASKP